MKKIMILGAGIYQVPLILKAKEMGFSTLVVSYKGNYPGFALADECLYLDTRDVENIRKAAVEKQIDGICTTGTDVAIRTLGSVAESLHLPGLSRQAAEIVTDKFLMRQAFQKGQVPGISFRQAFSPEEALNAFEALSSPVMVKAVDSSGSRGITRASTPEEVLKAYELSRSVTRLPYVLVENFIPGHEIGVDGFISNGEIQLLLPHEKFVVRSGNTTLPGGHGFPYQASQKLLNNIHQNVTLAIRAAGLDNCAFNADVMIHGEEAYVLELGGRCGATCIPELISIHCGFDYYAKILENAVGIRPDFSVPETVPCMAKLLFSPVDGVITQLDQEQLSALQAEGYIFSLDYQVGDSIEKVKNGTDRIGQAILKTSDETELDALLNRLYGAIFVNGQPLSKLWKNETS